MTSEKERLDMECMCPACGIRAALEDEKRCVQKRCPSCGAAMTDLDEKEREPSGSNVPSP